MATLNRHVVCACRNTFSFPAVRLFAKALSREECTRNLHVSVRPFVNITRSTRFPYARNTLPFSSTSIRNKSSSSTPGSEFTTVVSGGDTGSFSLDAKTGLDPATPVVQFLDPPHSNLSRYIPSPPETPDIPVISDQLVEVLGEPSFVSQGLGGWGPVGLVQHCLEYLHVDVGIPWWQTIVIGTCVVKALMFPLIVVAQRNSAKMNNNLPQMQVIQLKMSEARRQGNSLLAAKYGHELMEFMKKKGLNPLKNMITPIAQAPVFISFFFALRGMSNLPVESFKEGGMLWFTDLVLPDPYYILPLITSATLYFTIELGVDGGMRADNLQMMRYVLRAMPLLIFPFAMNFPAAVLCYWVTSNFISLGQVALLRYEPVRTFFKIEKLAKHDPDNLPIKKKSFVEGFKESYGNLKVAKDIEDRAKFDDMQFRKAGIGPIQKTYPYDPTKQQFPSNAAHAKPANKK